MKNGEFRNGKNSGLIERDRSCLVVIDVQQSFLDKLPLDQRGPLVERIAWLMRVARILDIPIVATAEDIDRNGPLVPQLTSELPGGAAVFNKMIFGLMDQADIRGAIEATKRDQFILTGLETDVCISQSAFGVRSAGFRPAVIDDACGTPPPHHEHALRRLRDADIEVLSAKGIYYEWCRDLATLKRIKPQMNQPLPAGLTL
jgi:nicotinamidase-related amidase